MKRRYKIHRSDKYREINWHRQHKWSGIAAVALLLVFCLSGIVLNHRSLFAGAEVSRRWLPSWYEFHDWNGGLMRGTIPWGGSLMVFGSNGVWIADTVSGSVAEFNQGFPKGADFRQVRNVVATRGSYYAATTTALYRLDDGLWREVPVGFGGDAERITDLSVHGDTMIVAGRSRLYVSAAPYAPFVGEELPAAKGQGRKVSLFKTVWMLHSGELFGLPGRIVVDLVAAVLVVLSLTGLVHWLLPMLMKSRGRRGLTVAKAAKFFRSNFSLHNTAGRLTIVLTIVVVVTGWCLRPPIMIPLAMNKTAPVPGSELDHENPWHDKLRIIRYDEETSEWLLSTSEGFYAFKTPGEIPRKVDTQFPVSVMGLNVLEKDSAGNWLCGSFSGMFRWDRKSGNATDYFTGKPVKTKSGVPFGKVAVSGYSEELGAVVEYGKGTSALRQPEELGNLPMSLWNVSLEAHTGRLFMGPVATYLYIFFAGFICFWCLLSGWKVRNKQRIGHA